MQNHISQTPEYRPCVITEQVFGKAFSDEVPRKQQRHHKALFHFWEERHQYYSNAYGNGIYAQPQHIIQTMAIVEYDDGTVHEVLPEEIRFLDDKIKEYDFKTDADKEKQKVKEFKLFGEELMEQEFTEPCMNCFSSVTYKRKETRPSPSVTGRNYLICPNCGKEMLVNYCNIKLC